MKIYISKTEAELLKSLLKSIDRDNYSLSAIKSLDNVLIKLIEAFR